MRTLTNEELKQIYHGAYSFGEKDGYLSAFQYTQEQMEYLKFNDFYYVRSYRSNAKTLEFTTTATKVAFDYSCENPSETIELAINKTICEVVYIKEENQKGRLEFDLPEGEKDVCIYLTADNTTYIRNFCVNADFTPIKKRKKALWLGDSITQGYGAFRSGETYVSVANRILDYEVINQGIGGYYYDENVLMPMEGYTPDIIIAAHGTNQYKNPDRIERVEKYYKKLTELYPNTPIITVTPFYRGDCGELSEQFNVFCKSIRKIAESYKNVTVFEGASFGPHAKDYYMPDWVHPNALACSYYGTNLANAIRSLGF